MRRRVWSVDELAAILRAVALAGGDPRTLAILAAALGLPVRQSVPAAGDGKEEHASYLFCNDAEICYNT